MGVATFDLDRFKSVDDRHGHATGDLVLIRLGDTFRAQMRDTDVLGGQERRELLARVGEPQPDQGLRDRPAALTGRRLIGSFDQALQRVACSPLGEPEGHPRAALPLGDPKRDLAIPDVRPGDTLPGLRADEFASADPGHEVVVTQVFGEALGDVLETPVGTGRPMIADR